MRKSYVYELLVDDVVRYIGMGRGNRINVHVAVAKRINRKLQLGQTVSALQVHHLLADALSKGAKVEQRFLMQGLTNEEARQAEVGLIAQAPTEQLWNVHPGGGGASSERMAELWADPEWRENQTRLLKKTWQDPEYRREMALVRSDPELRGRISDSVRERFSDPEERKKQGARLKAAFAERPEIRVAHAKQVRKKWSENREQYTKAVTAHWADQKHRERQSLAAKKQWSDPESRPKMLISAKEKWTPELRKLRSELTKKQLSDPDARKRMSDAAKARNSDQEYRKRMGDAIRAGKAKKRAEKLLEHPPQGPVR